MIIYEKIPAVEHHYFFLHYTIVRITPRTAFKIANRCFADQSYVYIRDVRTTWILIIFVKIPAVELSHFLAKILHIEYPIVWVDKWIMDTFHTKENTSLMSH